MIKLINYVLRHILLACDDTLNYHYEVVYNIARCWKFENKILYVGDNVYSLHLYPCPTGVECQSIYKICTDYSGDDPVVVTKLISKTPIGIPNCSTTKPTLPPLNKTWEEPWETECFETECQ